MLCRIVVGDAQQVRGIVELEVANYSETESGALRIFDEAGKEIGRWATGRWHSIVAVEAWNQARKAGVGDENPGRRQAPRPLQAL